MLTIVSLFVIATIVIAANLYAWTRPARRFVVDRKPDAPVPFGDDMYWIAIRSEDTQAIVGQLGLIDPAPANWRTGTAAIYDFDMRATSIFVSPPVRGWTLVAGLALPHPVTLRFIDKCRPLLEALSREFGNVQYYANDSVVELHAWVGAEDGRIVRASAVLDSQVIWDEGLPDRFERGLGLALFEIRGVENRKGDIGGGLLMHPTSRHVLQLARRWSLDPTMLDRVHREVSATPGVLAGAPADWRVERRDGFANAA